MTNADWATLIASTLASISLVFGGAKFVVKGWLNELKPNHGSSLHDRVNRIENRVDSIYDHLITNR